MVSKFSESSGLGISLEATVGHHFIRSILPEGPVGRSGKLFSGDELLEVRKNSTFSWSAFSRIFEKLFASHWLQVWECSTFTLHTSHNQSCFSSYFTCSYAFYFTCA